MLAHWRAALVAFALCGLPAGLGSASGDDSDCQACHADRELVGANGKTRFVDEEALRKAVHGGLACRDCHEGLGELPHPERLPKPQCRACHDDAATAHDQSVHGAGAGKPDVATCLSCHGPAHGVLSAANPESQVARQNLPKTCGTCHADPAFLAKHAVSLAKPVEAYERSVHGRALARGDQKAPACADCHGSHTIASSRGPKATGPLSRANVPETCGRCHTEIAQAYRASVHGTAAVRGVKDAPVCTDCHGEHAIAAVREPGSPVSPTRVATATCGRCHADERLAARYGLSADKVGSFQDSYHGLAQRAGSATVANCASCHGAHNVLPSRDPRSSVHTSNLPHTCGACHPGAGERFAIGPIHLRSDSGGEHPVVRFIRIAYLILIPLTIGGMLLHNLLDFAAKLGRGVRGHVAHRSLPRMGRHFRIAHWLVVVSFPVLVASGFALKFPDSFWATPWLLFEKQFAFRGLVHRVAGVLLIGAFLYHLVHLWLVRADRVVLRHLWPRLRDLRDLRIALLHNLGRAPRPLFSVFSYAEKAEYWAFLWGTLVMAASGILLWADNWSLRNLPKWVLDAATALHWYEAVLATLAILVWHFYMVIFDPEVYPVDRAFWTGRASAAHLAATRPAYYRALRRRERKLAPSDEDPGGS